jgi:hypothetical protein
MAQQGQQAKVVSSPGGWIAMVAQRTAEEQRDELRRLDDELARMREEAARRRRAIGERWDAPRDPEDLSAALTAVEEQEAIIAVLEERRRTLLGDVDGEA